MSRRNRRIKSPLFRPRVAHIIIVALVGVVVAVGIQTPQWKEFAASFRDQSTTEETNPVEQPDYEIDEFELFLKKATEQQLIIKITELVDDNDLGQMERLEVQQQRMRAIEELLSKTEIGRKDFAIISKLEALQTREWIKFDYGLTEPGQLKQLADFAAENVVSDDERIRAEAEKGRMTAQIIKYLRSVDDDDAVSHKQVLKDFSALCDRYAGDSAVAAVLLEYLERIHLHTEPDVFREFIQAFQDSYGDSDNEAVRELVEQLESRIVGREFRLTDIFAAAGTAQDALVAQLKSQLIEVLQRGVISQYGYQRIVLGIQSLAQVGAYEAALETSDMLRRRFASEDRYQKELKELSFLRHHWELVGQTFSYKGLTSLEGDPFQPSQPDARIKAVLFMTPETMENVEGAIKFVMQTAQRYVQTQKFALVMILVCSSEDQESKLKMTKLASLASIVDFGLLDRDTESGQKLLEQLEIRKPPMMLMLDQDDRIVAIDVSQFDFANRLKRLMSDD